MFYQGFVGPQLRERSLEGNDTHEIKPILTVSRNANVGTNRARVGVALGVWGGGCVDGAEAAGNNGKIWPEAKTHTESSTEAGE